MQTIRDPSGEYGDCAYEYLNFENFSDNSRETVLFYGYQTPYNNSITDYFKN